MATKFYPYLNKGKYVDMRKAFSFGCRINVFIGARGFGKTYGGKKYALKQNFRQNKRFVFLRDNELALQEITNNNCLNFLKDVKNDSALKKFFKGKEISFSSRLLTVGEKEIGYFYATSTYYNLKGNDFSDVDTIIYDEFIKEKGQAQRGNRALAFLNMVETIFRLKTDGRIILNANALDRGDEILDILGIKIDKGFGFYVNRDKDVCCYYCCNSQQFEEAKMKSLSGKLSAGTVYGENLNQNKFSSNDINIYDQRPKGTDLLAIFKDESGSRIRLAVGDDDKLYIYNDPNPRGNADIRFVNDIKLVDPDYSLAPPALVEAFKSAHGSKNALFESARVYNIFISIFGK